MKAHMQLRAKIQLRERDNKLNEVSEQHLISPKTDLLKRSQEEIMETPNLCFFNSPEHVHNGLVKLDHISFQNMQVKVQEPKQSDTLKKRKISRS